ncbi:MAG TPA: protein phosphatase 2C domain-containing protein [Chloroflexota bacterium]|nr:protein phosphatase 2C domain-containing protein [Chloroflexota bacterium]
MILEAASASHPGRVRPTNEDALASAIPEAADLLDSKGALFGVADGVGGRAAGEVASREAMAALLAEYYSPRAPHQVELALRQAVQAANVRVFRLSHGTDEAVHGMQTTLTAVVLAGGQAYVAHAGDCRAYLLRDGQLTQLTDDHSEAAELLRLRLITPEQARRHPRRGVLTRTLGRQPAIRPDFSRQPLRAGDRFLLCSDGLWDTVERAAIERLLQRPAQEACQALLNLASQQGGGDNISLHVVHVLDPGRRPATTAPARLARLLAGLRGG